MRFHRRLLRQARASLCLIPFALAWPSSAAAEAAPSHEASIEERRAAARKKYEAGVEAYEHGRYKDAVDAFLAADRLAPSAPLSFNVARAYERLGDGSSALRWYRDYLRRAPNAPNAEEVRAIVRDLAAALAKKGVQQITILSTPAGATVTIDGQPSGVTPWTADLPPGKHHVLLTYRGYADQEQTIELGASEPLDVTVHLEPAQEAAPPSPQPAAPLPPRTVPDTRDRPVDFGIWPWVTIGAGAAALTGAVTFELLRRSAESDAEKEETQLGYQAALDTMESRKTTARVLAGVGGALAIAGVTLLIIDGTGRSDGPSVGVGCIPGECAVSAGGWF